MLDLDKKPLCVKRLFGQGAALAGLLAGWMIASPVLADTTPSTATDVAKAHHKKIVRVHKAPHMGLVEAPSVALTGPVYKGEPPAAVLIPPCSAESAAALNKTYNVKGWDIPTPNFANSLSQDRGCWRSELAKYGFGFVAYGAGIFESNMLNHYVPSSKLQQYIGDRSTAYADEIAYLTYDTSRWGIPDGQLVFGGFSVQSTWIGATPNTIALEQLSYYQTLFNRKLELQIGYIPFQYQFVGPQLGGSIYNVLGPASSIFTQLGASSATAGAPSAMLKWNILNGFYDKAAVIRSGPTTSVHNTAHLTSLEVAHYSNPTNFGFATTPYVFGMQFPTERALFVNEIGYKNEAAPGEPYTWIRVTGMYNTTQYENLQYTSQQTTDGAVLAYADRQIWQSEPGDPATAYKGIYIGGTASWASPVATAVTQDYQFRLYEFGLFGRPKDQLSFTWEHEVFSPYVIDPLDASSTCLKGVTCGRHDTNQYTVVYNAWIMPGVFAGLGVSYVDHPSTTYSPNASIYGSAAAPVLPQYNIGHALNFLASVFVNL